MVSSQKWKGKIILLNDFIQRELVGGAVGGKQENLFSSFAKGSVPEPHSMELGEVGR